MLRDGAGTAGARTVRVELAPPYDVHVGSGALELADPWLAARDVVVLTDATVEALHGARLGRAVGDVPRCVIPPGEAEKSLARLAAVLDFLAAAGLDREGTLVTLGGGVVCDLGGLAASLYMRGIAVVHCPTTLLAQVDAAVGGKTAVNLAAGKNLAGTFHQPRAVFADVDVLSTLPEDEFASGLGEVVKTALVDGEEALGRVEELAPALVAREAGALGEVVARCVALKARVVAADPREGSTRRALNLGHTFAHAIEQVAGYGRVPHGVAVAVGILLALRTARRRGILRDGALVERVGRLVAQLGLPTSLAGLRSGRRSTLPSEELLRAMRLDKKGRGGALRLVLPAAPGHLELDVMVEAQDLKKELETN